MPLARVSKTEYAIIYIRVSSARQVQNASLETQEHACRDYCAQMGWEVLKVFREEGESAKTANRTQLQVALRFCRENKPRPRFFVVYHVDRFARQGSDHDALRKTLLGWDVLLRSASQQLGESPMEKFIERIWSGQSELDNDIRKEKTLGGMETRLRQGNWTHKAPLGYRNVRNGNVKTTVHDSERAPLIREAFERFATGLYKRQAVLEWINDKGLRTWQGKPVSTETFRRMLCNPLYAGRMIVRGKKEGAGADWTVNCQANFPPIVSPEIFDKVQGYLAGRRPTVTPRRRANPDFPLRSFVRCGNCDKPLTGSKSTGRSGEKYAYYHCQNKKCLSRVSAPKEAVETDFVDFLRLLRPEPHYLRLFRETVVLVYERKGHETIAQRNMLERELQQKREDRRRLNEAYIYRRREITEADYRELKEAIEQDILALEMKISDAAEEELEIGELLDFSENLLLDAAAVWNRSELGTKQRLQQVLFPQGVTYSEGCYRTTVTHSLFSILAEDIGDKEQLVALPGIEPGFED